MAVTDEQRTEALRLYEAAKAAEDASAEAYMRAQGTPEWEAFQQRIQAIADERDAHFGFDKLEAAEKAAADAYEKFGITVREDLQGDVMRCAASGRAIVVGDGVLIDDRHDEYFLRSEIVPTNPAAAPAHEEAA